jgi:hypothetical protein
VYQKRKVFGASSCPVVEFPRILATRQLQGSHGVTSYLDLVIRHCVVPCAGVGWLGEPPPGDQQATRGKGAQTRVVERIAEHYDIQEVPFGRDYRWSPEQVVLECKCGKRTTLKRSELISSEVSSCGCSEEHTVCIREELVIQVLDEEYEDHHHPWRHDTQAQDDRHLRDEAAYPTDSRWRYNDVTSRSINGK